MRKKELPFLGVQGSVSKMEMQQLKNLLYNEILTDI